MSSISLLDSFVGRVWIWPYVLEGIEFNPGGIWRRKIIIIIQYSVSLGQKKTTLKKKRKNRKKNRPKKVHSSVCLPLHCFRHLFLACPSPFPLLLPHETSLTYGFVSLPVASILSHSWCRWLAGVSLLLKSYWTIHFHFSLFLKLHNSIQRIKNRKNIPLRIPAVNYITCSTPWSTLVHPPSTPRLRPFIHLSLPTPP